MTASQALLDKFATFHQIEQRRPNNCNKFESGSCASASNSNALCLHLLIGLCRWQQTHLPLWQGPSVNLALCVKFCCQSLGCQPLCPKQGIESAEECSAILADPRCVLNIKSSAVIPLAAPNTNRGLLVAMATALLSNIASNGFASLWVFSLFFHFPACCSCLLRPHFIFFLLILSQICEGNVKIPCSNLPFSSFRMNGPRVQVHSISSRWRRTMFDCSQSTLHFYFFFYGLFSSGIIILQFIPSS